VNRVKHPDVTFKVPVPVTVSFDLGIRKMEGRIGGRLWECGEDFCNFVHDRTNDRINGSLYQVYDVSASADRAPLWGTLGCRLLSVHGTICSRLPVEEVVGSE